MPKLFSHMLQLYKKKKYLHNNRFSAGPNHYHSGKEPWGSELFFFFFFQALLKIFKTVVHCNCCLTLWLPGLYNIQPKDYLLNSFILAYP